MPEHYTRAREMDLALAVQAMTSAFGQAAAVVAQSTGRNKDDTALATLLALAVAAKQVRTAFDLPVEAWAEANSIAASPASLTNSLPALPRAKALGQLIITGT